MKKINVRLFVADRRDSISLSVVALFVLICVPTAVLTGAVAVKSQFDQEHAIRFQLQTAYEYRSSMRAVLIDLQDAETGQRGFLLTGRRSYLVPYERAKSALPADLSSLSRAAEHAEGRVAARLTALSREKIEELEKTIALSEAGRREAALAVVRTDQGQHAMDQARSLVTNERFRVERRMAAWTKQADQTAQTTQRAAALVGVLMLLALGAAAALIWQALQQRRRVIVDLARANLEVSSLLKTSALAEKVSDSGHWTLCVANDTQTWSPGLFTIFGLDEGAPPNLSGFLSYFVALDRERLQDHLDTALQSQVGFEAELAIIDACGALKQLRLRAEFVHDTSAGCLVSAVRDITHERRTQMELVESEERYRHLADSSTDMMATMSVDSTIQFISPACRRVLGYEPEELIGRRTLSLTHSEDVAGVLAVFEGLRRAGPGDNTYAYRFRGRHKDGGWVWLEGQPRIEFDASGSPARYQDVVREIGSRKAAEEALETSRALALASERRYRLLAENATDMIARYGLNGVISYVSPACEQVLGYSPEELVGRSTLSLVEPEDLCAIREQFRTALSALSRQPMHTEHRVRRRDGRTIWLEGRPRLVFNDAGEPIEYQDVMRDVTSRKAMEAELREARGAAEAAARSKADFLANMSHELRTPLNSVVGFAGLIAVAPELGDETRNRARIVRDASRALVEIVNDILDFSRIEAEGLTLSPEPTDLAELLRSTAELMQQQAEAKGVELKVSVLADVGTVMVDPSRVRQVALNLLGNAVKFTERGSVTMGLTASEGGELTISVRDTGVGIAQDRLAHIFERFAQADGSTSRRFGETGLGLTICKLIAQAMGGKLSVSSILGQGSTFDFTIRPLHAIQMIETDREDTSSIPPVAGLRVLVADDNVFNQDLFIALMAGQELTITLASNGQEAVEAVQNAAFDIVFMDMQMPIMDGLEATRAIRALGKAELPIVALTANVVQSQIELCLAAGMNDHLAKPYTVEAALAVMQRWRPAEPAEAGVANEAVWAALTDAIGPDALDGLLRQLAAQLEGTARLMREVDGSGADLELGAQAATEAAALLGFGAVAETYRALLGTFDGAAPPSGRAEVERATDAAIRRIERRLASRR